MRAAAIAAGARSRGRRECANERRGFGCNVGATILVDDLRDDLLAHNRHMGRSFDADADSALVGGQHYDANATVDHDGVSRATAQDQHRLDHVEENFRHLIGGTHELRGRCIRLLVTHEVRELFVERDATDRRTPIIGL